MDGKDFCYWLRGYFEMTDSSNLSEQQVEVIKDHLKLIFKQETPNRQEAVVKGELKATNIIPDTSPRIC